VKKRSYLDELLVICALCPEFGSFRNHCDSISWLVPFPW